PILRCSGESTRNKPPNDHHACPPIETSGSWSSRRIFFFASANSHAATKPAKPAPTMIASYSISEHLSQFILKFKFSAIFLSFYTNLHFPSKILIFVYEMFIQQKCLQNVIFHRPKLFGFFIVDVRLNGPVRFLKRVYEIVDFFTSLPFALDFRFPCQH